MYAVPLAWLIVLAGCGRLDFQERAGSPNGGDGGDPGTVTLVVTSDASSMTAAGMPIAGATVLIDRGGGSSGQFDRTTTDAAGTARFATPGVVAYHVVYKAGMNWRVYTMAPSRAGTIELGGRSAPGTYHLMTFSVPDNGGGDFTMHLPEHCATPPLFGAPTLTIDYSPSCEGKLTRVIAYSTKATLTTRTNFYLDAGNITLTSGSMHAVTGVYATVPAHTIQITNLPAGTASVGADILARSDLDLTPLGAEFDSATPQGRSATVVTTAAPGGNTLRVQASSSLPLQYSSLSERLAPATIAATTTFDAQGMLPLFESLVLTQPPSIAWTGASTGGTIIAADVIAGAIQWDAYLDPSATAATFPQLPSDLAVPIPSEFDLVTVVKLDVPGATAASLAPSIDRTWSQWPNDAALLPPEGSSQAEISYTIGLGPPVTAGSAEGGGSRPASSDRDRAAAGGSPARARPGVPGGE